MAIAVIMPVGDGDAELARCRDTVEGLTQHEPDVRWLVFVDDAAERRDFGRLVDADDLEVVTLPNPAGAVEMRIEDRIACAVIAGLAWTADHTDADFVMKLDTDALVIGRFAERLREATVDPRIGLIGSYERTCNGEPRSFGPWITPVLKVMCLIRGRTPVLSHRSREARRILREARRHGYRWGEHVLACAFAIPRVALDAICRAGLLDDPLLFSGSGLGDDPVLAIFVRYVGYVIANDHPARPIFGVTWRGLPDTPEHLLERETSIVHSTKNDPRVSEAEIREFFASKRAHRSL